MPFGGESTRDDQGIIEEVKSLGSPMPFGGSGLRDPVLRQRLRTVSSVTNAFRRERSPDMKTKTKNDAIESSPKSFGGEFTRDRFLFRFPVGLFCRRFCRMAEPTRKVATQIAA